MPELLEELVELASSTPNGSGREITLDVQRVPWTPAPVVGDTGPGIAATDLPHVTEELYRGEQAQRAEGSGLGLALAERLAALHSGELVIRSRPGAGTLVALRLPHRRT